MKAKEIDEILKHFPDLEEGWKEMKERFKKEPAEREMLSLKYREMLQRESSKESLVEPEFTKAKMVELESKAMKANEAPETYPIQFKDKIDEYLWKEHHILGGCCSSIEEMKYSVAREVAEKLTETFIEKAYEWLKNSTYGYLTEKWGETELDRETLAADFAKYMKGE